MKVPRDYQTGTPGDDTNLVVDGDRSQLGLIAANLIANAAHHVTPETSATINLRLSEDGQAVILTVVNATDPLAIGDLTVLFEPLERGRGRTGGGGHGVGLAIAHAAARAHRGELTLSQPDPATFGSNDATLTGDRPAARLENPDHRSPLEGLREDAKTSQDALRDV